MDTEKEKKAWREVKYSEKFRNAFRGLHVFAKTTRHLFIHVISALTAVILGFCFNISNVEWILIVLSIGLVFVTEILNTAIEIDIDLTSPEYHPFARDTKDVAAGAVLLSAVSALIVGLIIFLPKIINMIQ